MCFYFRLFLPFGCIECAGIAAKLQQCATGVAAELQRAQYVRWPEASSASLQGVLIALFDRVFFHTADAFDGYDASDVAGLLEERLGAARQNLDEAREAIKALCEPVDAPADVATHPKLFLRCRFGQRGPTQSQRAEATGFV